MTRHESDLPCLRCGREDHTSDECPRPLPAWPADAPAAAKPACSWPRCSCLPAERCPALTALARPQEAS